jgi:beta-galactosidase
VTGSIHQTLPLNDGLQTSGIYVYPTDIDVSSGTAKINVESEVANESGDNAPVTLSVMVVDFSGKQVAKFEGDAVDMVNGEKTIHKAVGRASGLRFWSPEDPVLYDVYTTLSVDNKVVDVVRTRTGFRKVEFRGGVGRGGVYINGKFTYLKGYSQRASDEWAGLGQAYPDWMHDFTARLIRDSHANYVRWMHISPQRTDVDSFDKYGIVDVCPAGDKEKDAEGRQWHPVLGSGKQRHQCGSHEADGGSQGRAGSQRRPGDGMPVLDRTGHHRGGAVLRRDDRSG